MAATHRMDGVLLANAPSVRAGDYQPAELRDVAPTLLQMLGLGVPSHMSGRPLRHVLRGSARPASSGISPAEPRELELSGITDADQRTVEARLRDLGYLD